MVSSVVDRSILKGPAGRVCGLLSLTQIECDIFSALRANRGNFVSSLSLTNQIWGKGTPNKKDSIKAQVCTLRRKIRLAGGNPLLIENQRGKGYRLLTKPI